MFLDHLIFVWIDGVQMKHDKRKRPNLRPPRNIPPCDIACNNVSVMINNECYRKFYEIVMHRGTSGAETLREMIDEEYDRITKS